MSRTDALYCFDKIPPKAEASNMQRPKRGLIRKWANQTQSRLIFDNRLAAFEVSAFLASNWFASTLLDSALIASILLGSALLAWL